MHLIVHMYPDPAEQAKAVTAFGGMGAIGTVLGLLIGALFVGLASWPWVFYFSSMVSAVITASTILLVPRLQRTALPESKAERILRFRRLDLGGVFMFTVAAILFIFAITSGSIDGWGSAQVIAPLVISFVLIVAFFFWESRLSETYAAMCVCFPFPLIPFTSLVLYAFILLRVLRFSSLLNLLMCARIIY
jgi:MFS family permease